MLREDRFQLSDFIAQSLALCKRIFQPGSKIALILHEGTLRNNRKRSGLFWVDYREPLYSGNLTEAQIYDKFADCLDAGASDIPADVLFKRLSAIQSLSAREVTALQ